MQPAAMHESTASPKTAKIFILIFAFLFL